MRRISLTELLRFYNISRSVFVWSNMLVL